jgi:hypothetical protein
MRFLLEIDVPPEMDGRQLATELNRVAMVIEPRTHDGLERCQSFIWDKNNVKIGKWKVVGAVD